MSEEKTVVENEVKKEIKEIKETEVIIKRGMTEFKLKRSNIMDSEPTHDGIVFNLKDGIQFHVVDINFTSEMKQLIKNTLGNYTPEGTVIIDLNNYKKPVQVNIG